VKPPHTMPPIEVYAFPEALELCTGYTMDTLLSLQGDPWVKEIKKSWVKRSTTLNKGESLMSAAEAAFFFGKFQYFRESPRVSDKLEMGRKRMRELSDQEATLRGEISKQKEQNNLWETVMSGTGSW
jgi:hypothetical protein